VEWTEQPRRQRAEVERVDLDAVAAVDQPEAVREVRLTDLELTHDASGPPPAGPPARRRRDPPALPRHADAVAARSTPTGPSCRSRRPRGPTSPWRSCSTGRWSGPIRSAAIPGSGWGGWCCRGGSGSCPATSGRSGRPRTRWEPPSCATWNGGAGRSACPSGSTSGRSARPTARSATGSRSTSTSGAPPPGRGSRRMRIDSRWVVIEEALPARRSTPPGGRMPATRPWS